MSKYNPAYSDSGEHTKNPMKSDEKYYAQVVNANVRFCFCFFFLCYNTLIGSLWLVILQIKKYNDNSFSYQFYISFNCFFHLWQKRKNKSMKTYISIRQFLYASK